MIPLRWRSAAQKLHKLQPQLTSLTRTPKVVSTSFRTRTALSYKARQRVQTSQSRVLNHSRLSSHQNGPALQKFAIDPSVLHGPHSKAEILHSAFPTKTVIFFLILGATAYYFLDVRWTDWTDNVLDGVANDSGSIPLHFYKDLDELNHWLDFHNPDPCAPMRDPQFLQLLSERFDNMVGGFMMSDEESQQADMPITHGCRYKSNVPCEDHFALGTSLGPGTKPWNYWAIFDGHAGRQTALYLQWNLIPHLSLALSKISPSPSSHVIDSAIKQAFVKLDDDLMARARHAASWLPPANAAAVAALMPAYSGSCALLAAFDPEKNTLRVACTGDSRAVLGHWDPIEEKYVCKPLSVDQTGFNKDEVERLTAEHPDEPDIISPKTGRLLGIAVTRAFGDHRWKWDNDFIKQLQAKFWSTEPRPGSKTPPYMTAEPVITETEVVRADAQSKLARGDRSDFMIMASDGLWDHMSSEHAVECVSRWLDARDRGNGSVANDPHRDAGNFANTLQADRDIDFDVETGKEITWKASPEHFVFEDENAAVCLTRNAMGGSRRNLFLGILNILPPRSRYAVDDTTVLVVFFDKVDSNTAGKMVEKRKNPWWWPW